MQIEVMDPGDGLPPIEILSFPASSASHLLIVPGNPGSAWFYAPFMRHLHGLLEGQVNVLALSFPGHEARSLSSRLLSLQETIQLVERTLATFPAADPVAVVGHSIGAYIALQALRRDPGSRRVVAAFPYVQFDESSRRQRMLRSLAAHLPLTRALMAGVRLLVPGAVRRRMASWYFSDDAVVEAALRVLEDRAVTSTFTLARHEFADLAGSIGDRLALEPFRGRVTVLCARRDQWFPASHRQTVATALGGESVRLLSDVSHSFCVYPQQSRIVAGEIARELKATWCGARSTAD